MFELTSHLGWVFPSARKDILLELKTSRHGWGLPSGMGLPVWAEGPSVWAWASRLSSGFPSGMGPLVWAGRFLFVLGLLSGLWASCLGWVPPVLAKGP